MNKPTSSHWSCDAATGELYENSERVGTLITGTNGAWFRLIEQANAVGKREVLAHAQGCNCELCYIARESMKQAATTVVMKATPGAPHEYTGAYTLGCEICGGHHTGEHAWEWDYLPRHSRKIIPFRGEMDYGGYGGQPFTPLKYTVQAFTKAWIESAVRDENMLAAWNAAAEEHPMVKSLVTSLCNSSTPLKFGAPDPFTGRYNLEEDDDNCLKTNQ